MGQNVKFLFPKGIYKPKWSFQVVPISVNLENCLLFFLNIFQEVLENLTRFYYIGVLCTLLFIRVIRSTSRTLLLHVCDHSRPHKFTLYSQKARIGMNVDTFKFEVVYYCIGPQAQLLVDEFYFMSYKF